MSKQLTARFSEEECRRIEEEIKFTGDRTVSALIKRRLRDTMGLDPEALRMLQEWEIPDLTLQVKKITGAILKWRATRDAEIDAGEQVILGEFSFALNGIGVGENYSAIKKEHLERLRHESDSLGELEFLRWLTYSLQMEEASAAHKRWEKKEITEQELAAEVERIRRKYNWKLNPHWPENIVEGGEE